MKQILIIISLLVFTYKISFAQNTINYIFDLEYESFLIGDDFKKHCLIDKYVLNDTLYVEIFSQFECYKMTGWIHLENDTLKLNASNDYIENEATTYDSTTGEHTTTFTINQPICCGRCGFLLKFKTSLDFKDKPIQYNYKQIVDCIDETRFDIIGNDTVNEIDNFGMKQGAWMTFHDNGNLATLDTFRNDQIKIGYKFDNTGKTISKTTWDGYQTWTYESITDTLFFRDLPNAPKINTKTKNE
jgi:hypothetical protein